MKKINWWRVLHVFIILLFATEISYGFFQVFFAVGGERYPLFMRAVETPIEIILKRRLYAVEVWIAMSGLSVYLALTEFLPRMLPDLVEQLRDDPHGEQGPAAGE